jgi:hypothetical protein
MYATRRECCEPATPRYALGTVASAASASACTVSSVANVEPTAANGKDAHVQLHRSTLVL